ncbi:MAG TPA: fructose-bisphosphatase class III [Planctomycetota bacterium]|nr:fructose-bisphosphatase class III [Planctomycetota bacterium]
MNAHADLNTPEYEMAVLRPLSRQFPSIDAASAEIARLSAELTLPKGTIHVISDVHGEDKKLRHVINNASGTLRPLIEKLFKNRLEPKHFQEFLNLIFYPAEMVERLELQLTDPHDLRSFAQRVLKDMFEVVRILASRYSLRQATRVFPPEYAELLAEILHEPASEHGAAYTTAIVDELVKRGRALHLIHLTGRVIRNLAVNELILAGDCWDRGPRGDRVVEYLLHQPHVSFIWGNHDAAWMGACKGHDALIAHVIRISLRYRRLSQLEEGYGITLQPLEHLVRELYADDPAECYSVKGTGLRETLTMMRMQKAIAIMQFKLEGQMIARHPEWHMDHRRLLHRINLKAGTIELDGKTYPLKDRRFPTINETNPYELSPEEKKCMERLRQSFLRSQKLWSHVRTMVENGSMYLRRDDHLIFHGCVPVDEKGEFLLMEIDGQPRGGRALFDAIEEVVVRAMDKKAVHDLDMLWYLWSGPRSPLFGKDRIATLEMYLIDDKATHHESKNPYFQLIHEKPFCEKVLAEFGVNPDVGLIVNGHVPVKVEKGENPLKKSGKAITIDGAFSEAYGDHGFTLVLEPDQTFLAKHYHFESVEAAIRDGIDIIPEVTQIRKWDRPRHVSDTERGKQIHAEIALLERLIDAYRHNRMREE